MLLIAGLTSHRRLTGSEEFVPLLRSQTEHRLCVSRVVYRWRLDFLCWHLANHPPFPETGYF